MQQFELSRYFSNCLDDTTRTAEQTVLEYIHVFSKWSKDCHYFVKDVRNKVKHGDCIDELNRNGAWKILLAIRKKYCPSKNRQYSRCDCGHYYIGGANKAFAKIDKIENIDKKSCIIYTKPNKEKKLKVFKFILRKVGKIWKISEMYSFHCHYKWYEESL